jgi:hypothetical protein
MAHPVIVIASFLTTIKSAWELSRMVRQKRAAKTLKTETKSTYVLLQRAYRKGLLLERQFDHLFERLMRAEAHNDGRYIRRVLAITPLTPVSCCTTADSCRLSGHPGKGTGTAGPATGVTTEGHGVLNWLTLEHGCRIVIQENIFFPLLLFSM